MDHMSHTSMLGAILHRVIDTLIQFLTVLRSIFANEKRGANKQDDASSEVLRLTYFDAPGLAEATRNTFNYGNIPFVDERIDKEEFHDRKSSFPFGQVPVLTVNKNNNTDVLAQSLAILRYASKRSRTYPSDPMYAAMIDQWCDLHTEFMQPLILDMYPARFGVEELGKKHRKWCVETHIPKYFAVLEKALDANTWLAEMNTMSMADMCWFPTIAWVTTEFDGVDKDILSSYPNIARFITDAQAQMDESDDESTNEEEETDAEGDKKNE